MNQVRSLRFVLPGVAIGLALNIGCRSDPRMIFIEPRTLAAKPDPLAKSRKKSFLARGEIPKSKALPKSNGIDVPIIEGK